MITLNITVKLVLKLSLGSPLMKIRFERTNSLFTIIKRNEAGLKHHFCFVEVKQRAFHSNLSLAGHNLLNL